MGDNTCKITASYSKGLITRGAKPGGLVGNNRTGANVTLSYWDTDTSRIVASGAGVGKTTTQLKSPTDYTGIYADWRLDLNNDGVLDNPWDFGSDSDYPRLYWQNVNETTGLFADAGDKNATLLWDYYGNIRVAKFQYQQRQGGGGWGAWTDIPSSCPDTVSHVVTGLSNGTVYYFRVRAVNLFFEEGPDGDLINVTPTSTLMDYDSDDDGLIEISNLDQLNAVRWDRDGTAPGNLNVYAKAFPSAVAGMGCPSGCSGYELANDLNFDTNGNYEADGGDAYWNNGAGWEPLFASDTLPYIATFEGNGHKIERLYIRRSTKFNGLFGVIGVGGEVRNVHLVHVDMVLSGDGHASGALAGYNKGGRIFASSAQSGVTISVITGQNDTGGLVGRNDGRIDASMVRGIAVTGGASRLRAGGLAGSCQGSGSIIASYVVGGSVSGNEVGGLLGYNECKVIASYATAKILGSSSQKGGLIGATGAGNAVTLSYWDKETSGITGSGQGTGHTTETLQKPDGYNSVFGQWNVDLDGNNTVDQPWNFHENDEPYRYPRLFWETVDPDYDSDDDGLLEISTLEQLSAFRWDRDGDGLVGLVDSPGDSSYEKGYLAAFPGAVVDMCPAPTGCTGYELATDLDFDPEGDGHKSGDPFWNGGAGWDAFGTIFATFEGNEHTISNLRVNRGERNDSGGLFNKIGPDGAIRNLGLVDVSIRARADTGGLLSTNEGAISGVFVTGKIWAGHGSGLVHTNTGTIIASYSTADIQSTHFSNSRLGGLAYGNSGGEIIASYAAGTLRNNPQANEGETVGLARYGTITNSYWDMDVSGDQTQANNDGKTTAELQGPSGYTGIYANWDVDVDGDGSKDDPWRFDDSQKHPKYPRLSWEPLPAPDKIDNLKTVSRNGSVTLNWDAHDGDSTGVSGYEYSSDDGATWKPIPGSSRHTATYTVTGLTNGTPYTFRVRAVNATGGGAPSDGAPATPTDVTPSAPTNLRTWAGDREIGLLWDDPSDHSISSYEYSDDNGANWTPIPDSDSATTSYLITGLVNNRAYTIVLRAVSGVGNGASSAPITANPASIDYDTDDDGLIEVGNLAQLNAMRWDLNGDGVVALADKPGYYAAFGGASDTSCPSACSGYELTVDLDFDPEDDGHKDGDPYWDGGAGWQPLGNLASTFGGGGHNIANLRINRPNANNVGLFSAIGSGAFVHSLGLTDVYVLGFRYVGGLASSNNGRIASVFISGDIYSASGGGIVYTNNGTVVASYSTATVRIREHLNGLAAGLMRYNEGSLIASYAAAPLPYFDVLSSRVGLAGGSGTRTNSYWDVDVSGVAAGDNTAEGKTTSELQAPTGYEGIYADWDVDLDGNGVNDNPWRFGTASEYPTLAWQGEQVGTDYDVDDDGLIEIKNLDQLNAVRWDRDGNGTGGGEPGYADAFPDAATGMGCRLGCNGYELANNLTFDPDGNTIFGANDPYYNNGAGWEPLLPSSAYPFITTLEGNGHTIDFLTIKRTEANVGLFGVIGSAGVVRNLHLTSTNIIIPSGNHEGAGALAGTNEGSIFRVSVRPSGTANLNAINGRVNTGGLAGFNRGSITASYVEDLLVQGGGATAGGLVGLCGGDGGGSITASYIFGDDAEVRAASGLVGGMVGDNRSCDITASFSSAVVSGAATQKGGLTGKAGTGTITASYWDRDASGITSAGEGSGQSTIALTSLIGYTGLFANWNIDIDGDSSADDPWRFRDLAKYPQLFFEDVVPDQPQNYTVEPGDKKLTLRWDTADDGSVTHYERSILTNADQWLTIPGSDVSTNEYILTNLVNGNKYTVWLRAVNAFGAGLAISVEATPMVPPPAAPTGLTATAGNTKVTLTWADPGDNSITSYQYQISPSTSWQNIPSSDSNTTTYTVTGLTNGTAYTFHIRAVNLTGNGPTTDAVNATPFAPPDYDIDNDGLIEITNLFKLNAIRWDLDGDGVADEAGTETSYATAFPGAAPSQTCPDTDSNPATSDCIGYELTRALDFDTNGSGMADAGDIYWNDGKGWASIWDSATPTHFTAEFDGVGHAISNLFINRPDEGGQGLFGVIDDGAVLRNVNLIDVDITGNHSSGAVVGFMHGGSLVTASRATGAINGGDTANIGGLVGGSHGAIIASYAQVDVGGSGQPRGGLLGFNRGDPDGSVIASYSTGSVGSGFRVGGLIGFNDSGKGTVVTNSYWDTESSGETSGGEGGGSVGKTTSELQTPTGYTGIYADWNDLDGDSMEDTELLWQFGAASQYPALWFETLAGAVPAAPIGLIATAGDAKATLTWTDPNNDSITRYEYQQKLNTSATWGDWTAIANSSATTVAYIVTGLINDTRYDFRVRAVNAEGEGDNSGTVSATPMAGLDTDYDTDNDGLLEIGSLSQLNAMRWDLDGDGAPSTGNKTDYAAVFPNPEAGMGCPDTDSDPATPNCTGYELDAARNFDTDASGAPSAGDKYWNGGEGWIPIGDGTTQFTATFDGGGHAIRNLFINRSSARLQGLFGKIGSGAALRNVNLVNVDVTGSHSSGTLVAEVDSGALVETSRADGELNLGVAANSIGGLVGNSYGTIQASYAQVRVAVGGDGNNIRGGLLGVNDAGGSVIASYAFGFVDYSGKNATGGLIGRSQGTVSDSYWDRTVTPGGGESNTGVGHNTFALQNPTGYTGIYADWNIDLDGDTVAVDPWQFGANNQYPALSWEARAPGKPGNLTATAGDASVTLTWDNPSNSSITRYEYSVDSGSWTAVPSSDASTVTHTVTSLTNGTSYTFQVRAVNANGDGAASDSVTATPVAAPTAPAKPTGLTATAGDTEVTLTWTTPTTAASPATTTALTAEPGRRFRAAAPRPSPTR